MAELIRDGVPLHHRISAVLRSSIASGHYSPGSYLPGETALMQMYDVSRATVRRALRTLQTEGLIEPYPGKGTKVLAAPASPIRKHLRAIERGAANTKVDVLEWGPAVAPAEVGEALDLAPGARALKIVRLRRRGSQPLRYMVNFVVPSIGELISRADVAKATLLHVLEQVGHEVGRAEDVIGAAVADPLMADALKISVGDPVLELARTMFDLRDAPVAFQWTWASPTVYKVRLSTRGEQGKPISAVEDYAAFAPIETVC
ncbi:GntR family transcriptional regulator [Nocardia jiangxiensis]|uniref:GntR family transcriptional regulator n=1 Tax=Nocardia jiangxiensis TaxID=282685 RepID=A0ABW6SCF6_9NOCA|nr:GntR family transcriptional regulator [Nocardia jiangxiensis]